MTTSNDSDRQRELEPDRDRGEDPGNAPIRPSAPEGGEETGGARPPRPSQAEGERDESSREG